MPPLVDRTKPVEWVLLPLNSQNFPRLRTSPGRWI